MKKKKVKNLLSVVVMTLVLGMQAVVPVKAAEFEQTGMARTWVHTTCGTPVTVTAVPRCVSRASSPVRACTDRNHNAGSCHIFMDTFKDDYMITCPTCNITYKQGESEPYKQEVHRGYA